MVEAGRFKEALVILKEVEPQTRGDDLALSVLTGKIYLAIDRPTKALEFFEDADAQARRYLQAARRVDKDSAEPDYVLAVIALSLLGVPDSQMEAISLGVEKLAAQGSDEASLAKNRRVEINYR